MSADTIGMGMRFVRTFIGGPFAGSLMMVRDFKTVIQVMDRGDEAGRYVLSNLGWSWHEKRA